ncbi:hypothetical protein CYMTET_19728 [Cymbomonas tetramitiformis]|uniref:Uncharacterized protein n=1 Tax=Cymbomonas tetramitiformis TaxID=36881 RepID=A0AAE0G622_9CHLO|nr:hypothetical protein CYMTET_19728 [Cymbomonas tetramitiformis]
MGKRGDGWLQIGRPPKSESKIGRPRKDAVAPTPRGGGKTPKGGVLRNDVGTPRGERGAATPAVTPSGAKSKSASKGSKKGGKSTPEGSGGSGKKLKGITKAGKKIGRPKGSTKEAIAAAAAAAAAARATPKPREVPVVERSPGGIAGRSPGGGANTPGGSKAAGESGMGIPCFWCRSTQSTCACNLCPRAFCYQCYKHRQGYGVKGWTAALVARDAGHFSCPVCSGKDELTTNGDGGAVSPSPATESARKRSAEEMASALESGHSPLGMPVLDSVEGRGRDTPRGGNGNPCRALSSPPSTAKRRKQA